jgi:hypothetical protein
MGPSSDEIDRQRKETREHMDENLGALDQRAASNAMRYGRIAAVVVGVAAVAGAGWLIYRRINRPTRRERLQSFLIEALKDLPDSLRELPDEVATRFRKPMPSIKVIVNGKDEAKEPGPLESIVRRVGPAVVGTASGALIGRFTRSSEGADETRSSVPAHD